MFNRADGFDTFAASEGIDREFCEKEMSTICGISLNGEDAELIRRNMLTPIYSQFTAKSGETVQSCLTFLPVDYSGERSAYMVHSLIMRGEDKARLLDVIDGPVFDKTNFVRDLSGFDLLDFDARPISDYPEVDYVRREPDRSEFPEIVIGDMRRRFIGAVIALISGKIKALFVVTNKKGEEQSNLMCDLFNATIRILPYHMRDAFTFVTRVSNTTQLSGFKMRGIICELEQIKATKCAVISFERKIMNGISDDEITQQLQVIDFLIYISENEQIRRDFLNFASSVVGKLPAYGALTFQALSDLVLLFRTGSNYHDEKPIVTNDDKVLELITLYDKCRKALPDEYRIKIMHVLDRYPAEHREIPKKVFSKLTKMYPSEIYGTRRVILGVALELIHTDLMRDKLLSFLAGIIEKEEPDSRAEIIKHLGRVIYGGFLQTQILALFAQCYPNCDGDSKTEILEKSLLIIRTKAVQKQVLQLIDEHYNEFDADQKRKVLDTVFEQLREGDDLARELVNLINTHYDTETEDGKDELRRRTIYEIDREQKKQSHPMLSMLTGIQGFFEITVADHVVHDLSNRKIFPEWVSVLMKGSITERVNNIARIYEFTERDGDEIAYKLVDATKAAFDKSPVSATLPQMLDAQSKLSELGGKYPSGVSENIFYPIIRNLVLSIFRDPQRTYTVEQFIAWFGDKKEINEGPSFAILQNYLRFKRATVTEDIPTMVSCCDQMPEQKSDRLAVARYMTGDISGLALTGRARVAYTLMLKYLQTDKCAMSDVYSEFSVPKTDAPEGGNAKAKDKKAEAVAAEKAENNAVTSIIAAGAAVVADPDISEHMKEIFMSDSSGLGDVVSMYLTKQRAKGVAVIDEELKAIGNEDNPFVQKCRDLMKQQTPKQGGFLSSLFGKKK